MMRVEIGKNEAVTVVCEGKVIAEHVSDHDALESAYHKQEIDSARVAHVLLRVLRNVDDWQAFADGANNVRRNHPSADVSDYIGPPQDEEKVTPERVKQYQTSWSAGEYVRTFISEDQLVLFSEEAS